jgi:hypothetical protein
MWTPWSAWGRRTQDAAVENAREAAVECSRALVERIDIDLYLAAVQEERLQAHERPSVIA